MATFGIAGVWGCGRTRRRRMCGGSRSVAESAVMDSDVQNTNNSAECRAWAQLAGSDILVEWQNRGKVKMPFFAPGRPKRRSRKFCRFDCRRVRLPGETIRLLQVGRGHTALASRNGT